MAEVYRAKDTRLGRDVAIKVMSEGLAGDEALLERFEREAKLAASLSHPNVVALYDAGFHDGKPYFVTELLQGATLRERLAQGPLPLATALDWAAAMAQGLAAAHARGIVHRDLKPENVFITQDGYVKLIDFGIAKLVEEAREAAPHALLDETLSPSGAHTGTGMVLGTPGYMSPEQVRGDPVDARTDFFSLGAVLYEMLAGHRAFPASSLVESGYAILHAEPEPLPTTIPPALIQVVRRCLEKDPARRFQSARDLAFHLELLRAPTGSGPPTETKPAIAAQPSAWRRRAWPLVSGPAVVALAVVVLVLAVALLALRGRGPAVGPQLRLSQVTFAEGVESSPAWSGDGTSLAYSADVGNLRQIFVKNLQTGEEKRLTKSDFDDIQPAYSSPDSRTILFVRSRKTGERLEPGDVFGQYDDGDIWAIDVASGKETRIVENAFNPAYSPDGKHIAVDASWAGPRQIWIVDAQGHNPQQVTSDVSEAVVHVRPRWSPDGKRIVFQNIERTKFDVRVVDVASKALNWITNDLYQDIDPVWSPSGRFVYFSSNRSSGGLNLWRSEIPQDSALAGPPQQLTTGAGQDVQAALSPDGKKLAFAILKQNADLWKLPVSQETGQAAGEPQEVVATTREDSRGAWSPDGKWIAFNSDRSGDMNIWLHSLADGSTRQLTKGPGGDFQPTWSPDGRWIVFFSSRSGNADIWKVEVASGKLVQLTKVPSIDINPFFSPDGRQIAYQSDQGGRLEVWLMSADGGEARELTRVGAGGHFLRFSRDGRDVVFRCPTCGGKGQTMRVPVGGGDPQRVGEQAGGSHISFSPDFSRIMDVTGHKTLWVSPLTGGAPEKVFEFADPHVRIDYPVWSPDGRFVLFDRFRPQGGDIWVMEGFER
jgi:Tol biopolymer transport system component/tRNA A-37 threonylcarbamoyl transferase component Bud32